MKKATVIIGMLSMILCLAGCNAFESLADKSSSEADIEDAQEALDSGDYQEVIDILGPGYNASNPDPAATRILASAYMGKAGVDLTNLVESSGDDARDNFDVISSSLTFDITEETTAEEATGKAYSRSTGLYITRSSVQSFLGYLEQAQSCLTALVSAYNDDDDLVQLGMVSAVHFILKVGDQVSVAVDPDTNVPINKKAYQEVLPDGADLAADIAAFVSLIPDSSTAGEIAVVLQNDITNVSNAVDILERNAGEDTDISEKFDGFLAQLLGSSSVSDLSGTEIAAYIRASLLGY